MEQSAADEDVEREVRQSRKFSPQEAFARMAGPGAMKGASPISRVQQAENEIGTWLAGNLGDVDGALKVVLTRHLKGSQQLLQNVDHPLAVLADHCRRLVASDKLLAEVVREADVEWGRAMDERPYFDKAEHPPHPDDPYSVESVRASLAELLNHLQPI
ncbi:MAG: hypothetical protein ACJ8EY_02350 [Sphingomicrobium sp.]